MSTEWLGLEDDDRRVLNEIVKVYTNHDRVLARFLDNVRIALSTDELSPLIHSTRGRLKDPDHLREKLARKLVASRRSGSLFSITPENLLERVNDLVGYRILHLHTRQMQKLHPLLLKALDDANMPLVEEPFARTWDDESKEFFENMGIKTQGSPSLYTSVHYVIRSNSKTSLTAEIQVRTLAEELWGEVDHAINYPRPSDVATCREQLKVLARVTSSCTRLVDSIFESHTAESTPRIVDAKES